MADLVLVEGEEGFNIDFLVQNSDGIVDISAFDSKVLTIKTTDYVTTSLTKTLTFATDGTDGKARWAVTSGNVPTGGTMYFGQINLTDTGTQIRKTFTIDIEVERKLD